MINKCKFCDKEEHPIYTSIGYKMTPLCLECYKKNRKHAKNKYKKLMNKLSNKGYVWVLNIGDIDFPFTFFGLEVSFYQIVQYFFKFIDSDKYTFQNQEDYVFKFDDYPDPIITETYIVFINDEDGSTYSVNIRMGTYDYENEKLLFFTDKQLGLDESDLENYSSLLVDDNGELTEMVPNFKESFIPRIEFLDDYTEKSYFDDKDIESLVGFLPDFEN